MVFAPTSSTGLHALDTIQLQAADNGFSVIDGCGVSLSSTSTGPIEVSVDPGAARVAHIPTSVESGDYLLADGSADPRFDAVCVADETGAIEIIEGVPAPVALDSQGNEIRGESAYIPAPADTIGPRKTCLALVWVPENATTNDDLRADVANPVIDRRHEASAATGMGADLLDTYHNTDTSAAFDYISPAFDRLYDEYLVLCTLAGQGTGESRVLNIRVNENYTGKYFYNSVGPSGHDWMPEANSWRDGFRDDRELAFGWAIQGEDLGTTGSASRQASIQSIRGGDASEPHLYNGRFAGNVSVRQLSVRTNATATGKLAVYGRDF